MLQIVLRFCHVFFGALWVGMMAFGTFFMGPAVEEAGPDGGKVMAGLIRRKVMVLMPVFALITLVSGFWLFNRLGNGIMTTRMGKAFGFGGAAALLAFVFGMAVARPTMMRAQNAGSPAEMQLLRARANTQGRIVGVLLLIALGAMAVARYL